MVLEVFGTWILLWVSFHSGAFDLDPFHLYQEHGMKARLTWRLWTTNTNLYGIGALFNFVVSQDDDDSYKNKIQVSPFFSQPMSQIVTHLLSFFFFSSSYSSSLFFFFFFHGRVWFDFVQLQEQIDGERQTHAVS